MADLMGYVLSGFLGAACFFAIISGLAWAVWRYATGFRY